MIFPNQLSKKCGHEISRVRVMGLVEENKFTVSLLIYGPFLNTENVYSSTMSTDFHGTSSSLPAVMSDNEELSTT